jgi:hypothetical protein
MRYCSSRRKIEENQQQNPHPCAHLKVLALALKDCKAGEDLAQTSRKKKSHLQIWGMPTYREIADNIGTYA